MSYDRSREKSWKSSMLSCPLECACEGIRIVPDVVSIPQFRPAGH